MKEQERGRWRVGLKQPPASEFEESVLADEREASALGVSGVPAFVADRMAALSGVQSAGNLKRLVAHVRAGLVRREGATRRLGRLRCNASTVCYLTGQHLKSRAAKESRLFTRVADLLSVDVKPGEEECQHGEDEQARDGNPGGRRLGEHGEGA